MSRYDDSGTRQTFERYILGHQEQLVRVPHHVEVGTTDLVADQVQHTSGAIGYVDAATSAQAGINSVLIAGTDHSPEQVEKSNGYPFWAIEHMYTVGNPQGLISAFLDFMRSNYVLGDISALHFIDFNLLKTEVVNQHRRVPLPVSE